MRAMCVYVHLLQAHIPLGAWYETMLVAQTLRIEAFLEVGVVPKKT